MWCVCVKMPTDDENKCCGRRICITSNKKFDKICLDRDILEVSIKYQADYRAEEITFHNNNFRKAAYYQFIMWRYGKLGRGNRKILPSCVVKMIRKDYPDSDEIYMGFRKS